ncbi:unnamed protein product [Ectocarpus sp. CCAP 1310/34]|nr:unnamed protein product [Ectocarpus sp. CCAP 1310/34]
MARHGLGDPRKRPLAASRLTAALAVVLGGGDGVAAGRGGAGASAATRSVPSSPLFSAVLLRGTVTSGPPGNAAAAAAASHAAAASSAVVLAGSSAAAASAARRIIASSCTALHGLLRSDGLTPKNVSLTAAAAAAAAQALSPTLEAFVEVCRAAERAAASPAAAAPAGQDEGAAANGYHCGHARLPAGQNEEDACSWREARRVVSSLLDFVDGLLGDETKQGLHPAAHGRLQAGDGVLSSPPLRRHGSLTTTPSLAKSGAARRMWMEVRGLCGGEANARVAASRRLAGLLKEATIPEDERGVKQGGVAPFPFRYLDDPLHRPSSATPIAATVANSGESGKPAAAKGAPSEGRTLSFSAEHVKNLADVAGAPSLEGGLRRAAAEQLRGVLVSPGVAAVVLSDTGQEDLCERVLSAALSGLLPRTPPPPPPSSPIPSRSDGDRSEDPWLSPPPPCPLPGFPSTAAAPGTVVAGGRSGRNGFGEHLWDEAFLGLLLAAVREFAPVRRYLLASGSGCESGGWSGTAESELALAAGSPAPGHLSRSRKRATAGAVVAPNALPAVLRRLYHPRPSVRRLAGSVAVRLAFDSPSFFSPLECTVESPPSSRVGQDSDHERGGGGRCRVGGVASLGGGFSVPMMVLEAFPRLAELTREGTSSGGDGSENMEGDSSPPRRNDNRNNPSSSGRRRHEAFQTLVASEWTLLIADTAADDPSSKKSGERRHRSAVASQVAEALREAGRRTEFEAAMLRARAWMLAGFGYSEALFGPDGGWEAALERFLRAPPNGTKDRAAMRDVTSLLVAGTDHMCPRGFQVLADAAEECFVPILSETNRRPTTVLGDYLGDWKAPSSSKGSARDLKVGAVVSSSRPGSDEAAVSLAASSLPAVIWGEFLGGRAVGVIGWSWWERGDAEDGSTPLTARRLAAEFLTGLARRPRTGSAAVASWASLHVPPPVSDHYELGGGSQNLLAAAGWGGESSPAQHLSEPEPTPLLGMIVRSLVRHASTHRSPDSFRGRASLAANLVALETVLAAAALSPSLTPSSMSDGNGSLETTKSSPTSPVPVTFFAGRGVPQPSALGQGRRGEGGSGGGGAGDKTGLEWALRLACHRDATVRAVSFGVLAELAVVDRGLLVPASSSAPRDSPAPAGGPEQGDESPTGSGGSSARAGESVVVGGREEEDEEEAVEACVRAALDGRYESPAVATEALRFLCRHTNVRATSTARLPAYSVPLVASLAKSAAPVLGGESGQNEAGSLSVAAASLRFVVVVVVAAVDISDAAARSKLPGTADRDSPLGEQRESQEEPRRDDQHELQQHCCGQRLGRLLEVLWASGCLEACVHIVGEVLPVEGSSGRLSRRDGWSSLLASSPAEAVMAYLNAQAAALALLRVVVVSRPTVSTRRPTPAASTPPSLEEPPGPLEQTAASAAEWGCTPDASASAAGSHATDHDDGGAAVAAPASVGSNRPSAMAPAGSGGVDVWAMVRQALLQRTPLLAGLVRCLVAAAAALRGGEGTADRDSPCEGAVRVVREGCATLRCLLRCTDSAVVSGDDGGCSAISQAVFEVLGVVLAETPSGNGVKGDGGVSRRCGNGCTEATKTEAKLLLAAMLATRDWRCSLDLACEKALTLTAVLLEEEAVALTRTTAPGAKRNAAFSAEAELRRRCLVPLLESSDALRALAVTSGLIGDLSVALEALLGEIATVGHGRETLQNASRHLESLKAKHKKPAGGKKKTTATPSSPTSPSSDARGRGEGRGLTGKRSNKYAGRKPPIPTANAKLVTATSSKPSAGTAPRTSKPSTPTGQGRYRPSSLSSPPSLPSSPPLKVAEAPVVSVERGLGPEREFYMVAALMASAIGGPEGRAEALRLRLPQLLWKAWPMALASQLAHSSRSSSSHRRHDYHNHRRSSTSVDTCGTMPSSERRNMLETPVLLQALLGLASCVARSCPEGKKAFIFAGPEGPYGRAATEAACDVVRSCALSHECRTVLSQSGFFVDAFAQIRQATGSSPEHRRLCAKATKIKPGTASFTTLARRIGDLTGVLVNSSLRAEGQKALIQVEGACDMVGDLLSVCLRAASPAAATAATTTYSVLVTRTLLLLRNLALAPSTGQITAHRESVVDLILQSTGRDGEGKLTRAAASCLRAVLRGSSNDGGGKTAVGVGDRKLELAAAVDRCLGVPEIAALS